ncbi:MAG: DUF6713 family protein [Bacteroidota bacterium]
MIRWFLLCLVFIGFSCAKQFSSLVIEKENIDTNNRIYQPGTVFIYDYEVIKDGSRFKLKTNEGNLARSNFEFAAVTSDDLSVNTIHLMDAIRCREWRILPGLSLLPDRSGMIVFQISHIPLFYLILAEVLAGNEAFIRGLNIFLIIHLFLHLGFLWHSKNEFKDWVSWSIIIGAAVFATLDLLFP